MVMWGIRPETFPTGGRNLTCLTAVPEFCDGDQMRRKVYKLWGRKEREGRVGKGGASQPHRPYETMLAVPQSTSSQGLTG